MNQIPEYPQTMDMRMEVSENDINPERWMADYGKTLPSDLTPGKRGIG